MEPSRLLVAFFLALAGSTGCAPPDDALEAESLPDLARQEFAVDAGAPPCPSPGGTCVPVSAPIDMDAACPNTRWIAVLDEGVFQCPAPPAASSEGYWVGSKLFGDTASTWNMPRGLAPFCAYDWKYGPGGLPQPPTRLVDALKLTVDPQTARMDRDCQVVAPLGTSSNIRASWQTLHADFHAQTGQLATLPPSGTLLPVADIRVAVVDSSPHSYAAGEAVEDRLGHGHAIGRIIRELGCPDGSPVCISHVANHLALPQVTQTVKDLAHGGYFGEQTQLARSIHAAVSDWRSHNAGNVPPGMPATPQPRLVINLSLAWDGRYGGPYKANPATELSAPIYAVHAAITHAVCRGALVLAAAGNDPGGPEDLPGPMYPAAWEQKPAPTLAECDAFEEPGYPEQGALPVFPSAGAPYWPLVFGVGGVRGDDLKLENTRPGGRPRLAAPGAHALAADVDSSGTLVPTDVLTGTSAATAAVSGIASTVWGYRPILTAPELMELVRQGSVDLDVPADYCLGGRPCPWPTTDPRRGIRRVNLCRALNEVCAAGGGRCPAAGKLPKCAARPAYGAPLPLLGTAAWAAIEAGVKKVVSGSALTEDLPPLAVCKQSALRSNRYIYEPTVCPFRQYYGIPVRPWTNPQPSKNPCTVCLADYTPEESLTATSASMTLYISIDSEYALRTLDSPSLLLNGMYEIDLSDVLETAGQPSFTGGDEVKLMSIPIDPSWLPIHSAALNLRGEERGVPYSTSSELLLQ